MASAIRTAGASTGSGAVVATSTPSANVIRRSIHSSGVKKAGGGGAAPTSGVIPFLLADIGEGIAECEVMKWFVNVGDSIHQFDKVKSPLP